MGAGGDNDEIMVIPISFFYHHYKDRRTCIDIFRLYVGNTGPDGVLDGSFHGYLPHYLYNNRGFPPPSDKMAGPGADFII